jgi:hypothetical protein
MIKNMTEQVTVSKAGLDGLRRKIKRLEQAQAEHAALCAVAEIAAKAPKVPDIALWWNKEMKPALAALATVRKQK